MGDRQDMRVLRLYSVEARDAHYEADLAREIGAPRVFCGGSFAFSITCFQDMLCWTEARIPSTARLLRASVEHQGLS